MPRDLRIARPFTIVGSDNRAYSLGIAYYPQMDDAFCDHWFVQWHTQSQVLARGNWLVQWRWFGGIVGAFSRPMMIWVGTPQSPAIYGSDIEPGWPPIFAEDLDHFPPLELGPVPDFQPVGVDPVTGQTTYRPNTSTDRIMLWSHHSPTQTPTIKLYPGDPSPPVGRVTDPDAGRHEREEAAHRAMQQAQRRVVTEQAARYVDPPRLAAPAPWLRHVGEQATPIPPPMDWSRWTYRDPRQAA